MYNIAILKCHVQKEQESNNACTDSPDKCKPQCYVQRGRGQSMALPPQQGKNLCPDPSGERVSGIHFLRTASLSSHMIGHKLTNTVSGLDFDLMTISIVSESRALGG